ncbi:PH domain-containing protein [Microlunatus flavus]|uniref:PH domain-containing protein n=1 Tax=Microlunatus flavus TaxID=1036181 RepID=A0A1H9F3Z2_9ACTN|nr:PH domain-containing protein [Microlunatus flavus]SEQ32635.1 PH domain-containing protein [Microlunatus flavus]
MIAWLDPHVDQYLLRAQNEYVVREVRKHWAASAFAWVRLGVAVPLAVSAFAYAGPVRWVVLLAGLALGGQALFRVLDEYRDRFVITNMRVFRVHGTFSTQRASVPLGRILDITVKKPLLGRLLNYGHFVFESAAQVQGISEIRFVADIDGRDAVLQDTMQRAGLRATAPAQDDGT